MAYIAPYIDESGLHIPTYTDIIEDLVEKFKSIYGEDIYLDNDAQDYQMISTMALHEYDTMQATLLAYNNASSTYAIGAALDRLVTLNGITRTGSTQSTCRVTLTGTPGTKIVNGIVQDLSGYYWEFLDEVEIGNEGTVNATVKCQSYGKITASVGDLSIIATPTRGWISVTNSVAASPGSEQETDVELRKRQKLAVASPSRTVFEGTVAAVAAVADVKRYKGYENDTNTTVDGFQPHSIAIVVEGGNKAEIAQAIFKHKTPGCYTNGSTVEAVVDSMGNSNPIRFYYIDPTIASDYISVPITVTIGKLDNFVDETIDEIENSIQKYMNEIGIGESLHVSNLHAPALSAINGTATYYVKSISVSGAVNGVVPVTKTQCLAANSITVVAE